LSQFDITFEAAAEIPAASLQSGAVVSCSPL
jgi:hypothetical protein